MVSKLLASRALTGPVSESALAKAGLEGVAEEIGSGAPCAAETLASRPTRNIVVVAPFINRRVSSEFTSGVEWGLSAPDKTSRS